MAAANPYRLSDFLPVEHIRPSLPAEGREEVVRALLRVLVEAGRLPRGRAAPMRRMVEEREALGTTALGGGLAVPHARVNVETPMMAMALLQNGGEDWHPLDGAPVHGVFLFLTPRDDDASHRGLMQAVTRFARVPAHMRALRGCRTAEDIAQVIADYAS